MQSLCHSASLLTLDCRLLTAWALASCAGLVIERKQPQSPNPLNHFDLAPASMTTQSAPCDELKLKL